MLCKYKDIFGKPKKGIHSYRIFNIAIVDTLLTIVLAFIISYSFKKTFFLVFLILMIISIIVHKIFCVETTLTNLI